MSRGPSPVVFTLNGARVSTRAHPLKRLLDVLREDYGLTGTKEGCGEGECGACTVLIDGAAVNACLVPVAHVAGTTVVTIEGLQGTHPLQQAFADYGGTQCGICTPGMIMAAVALGPAPSLDDVRRGLAGNICRCTGYEGIYRAIRAASKAPARRASGTLASKVGTRQKAGQVSRTPRRVGATTTAGGPGTSPKALPDRRRR
jgi:aerobic-type carbon monoxide dehydrogenase small subunit (CoxS/CutS family)